MDLIAGYIGAHLNARDYAQIGELFCGLVGLNQPFSAVVVGDGDSLEPVFRHHLNQLSGSKTTIRSQGMQV